MGKVVNVICSGCGGSGRIGVGLCGGCNGARLNKVCDACGAHHPCAAPGSQCLPCSSQGVTTVVHVDESLRMSMDREIVELKARVVELETEQGELHRELARLRGQLATAREDASEMEKKAIAEGSEALALGAEVAALKAAAQWREMEDAPRDGTWILVLAKKESRAEGRGDVVRFIIDAPPGAFRWRARDWFGFFDDELVGWLPIPEIVGATV